MKLRSIVLIQSFETSQLLISVKLKNTSYCSSLKLSETSENNSFKPVEFENILLNWKN